MDTDGKPTVDCPARVEEPEDRFRKDDGDDPRRVESEQSVRAPTATLVRAWEPDTERRESSVPYHLGIIPDGNRRYARREGMSIEEGYLAGADKALEAVNWCLDIGVRQLSAFGASIENIARRSPEEVRWAHRAVLRFGRAVRRHSDVRLHIFGDVSALPSFVSEREELIGLQEGDGTPGARLIVHAGVGYSGQTELATLIEAARRHGAAAVGAAPEDFALSAGIPAVDLVVRTGGQQRLSGFLPFQTAYAELWFTPTFWPDIERAEFLRALRWYARQERRFGE